MFWSNVRYGYFSGMLPGLQNDWQGLHENYTPVDYFWNTILLSSMIKITVGGNGTLSWRYCALQEAVQRYPVTVMNSTLTMLPTPLAKNFTVYQFSRSGENNGLPLQPSTTGGFVLALNLQYSGNASVGLGSQNQTGLATSGSSPLLYVASQAKLPYDSYNITWSDPIDDMIGMLQELSLRMAITTSLHGSPLPNGDGFEQAAKGDASKIQWLNGSIIDRKLTQTVSAKSTYDATIYQFHFAWLSRALGAIVLAFTAILATFHGWWHLGRGIGMSPLELAKAFDAPLLGQVDPNAEGKDIVGAAGELRVQYGATAAAKRGSPLIQQHPPRQLESPSPGSEEDLQSIQRKRRLHFGREGMVERLEQGEVFGKQPQE